MEQSAMAALSKKRHRTKPKKRPNINTQRDYFEEFDNQQKMGHGYLSVDNNGNLFTASDTQSKYTERKGGSTKRKRKLQPDEEAQVEQSLYKTRFIAEEVNAPMNVEVVRKGGHKVFIRAWNTKLTVRSEVEMHLK